MFKLSTISFMLFAFVSLAVAQDTFSLALQERMLRYESDMVLGEDATSRKLGFDSLSQTLTQSLSDPLSFTDSLSHLRSVSVLYGTDSTFRVISLQGELADGEFMHVGYIQTKDTTYFLTDASDKLSNPVTDECSVDHWYGALYYHLEPYRHDGQERYLLLGYDGHSTSSRRKIIESLSFDRAGIPVLGELVFEHPYLQDVRRFILQYSSEVAIRLNYDQALKMIVFDHLIPMQSIYKNESVVMVSDGSYEGFKLKDGMWTHVEKVFHQVNQGAPGEGLSEERKKLFKN